MVGRRDRTKVHLVSARWSNYPWGFGNDVHDALVDLGIDIIDTDFRVERAQLPSLFKQPCDLMLVLKGNGIPPGLIWAAPCTTVLWYPDDLRMARARPMDIAYNGKAFNVVYSINNWDLAIYAGLGIEARWLPLGCNPKLHRKLDLEKRYDVSFVGSLYPDRVAFLERLRKRFSVHYEQTYTEAMVRVFNESKIVLNLPIGGFKSANIPHRIFEALACGSLLFTNELPYDSRLFRGGEHLVYYKEENIEDLLAHYLEHEEEREAIAEAGRKEVLARHTVRHRLERIMEETQ